MILFLVGALAVFTTARHHPINPVRTRDYEAGDWHLRIRRDDFSHQTRCTLRTGKLRYQRNAIGFVTHAGTATEAAWYSIDGRIPRAWADVYPVLYSDGVQLEQGGIDDPTRGVVWLPAAEIAGADRVAIEVRKDGHQRVLRYRMRGFAAMHSAAERLGCPPDGFEG
jgi:hypothetical protein